MKAKKPQIALNLPTAVALFIIFVRHVIEMMTKNAAIFTNPIPPLADVSSHTDDLEKAEIAAKGRATGAVQVRDEKRAIVESDIVLLRAYVFALASANITNAASIIAGAGMSEKGFTPHIRPPFEAFLGPVPPEVILRARAEKKRASYEWYSSADQGKTWAFIGSTGEAHITVNGLVAGTYQFRYRSVVKGVPGDWSDPAGLTIS